MGSWWYGHLQWFYYFLHFDLSEIIAFARHLPVTPALPVTSETCPLPLDYSSDGNALISAIATAALFPYFGWRLVLVSGRKPSASSNIRNTWLIVCGCDVVVLLLLPWWWQWRLSPPSRHSRHDWPQCPPFILTIILPICQKCDSQRNRSIFRWRTVGFHV